MKRLHLIALLAAGIAVGGLAGWFRPLPAGLASGDGSPEQWRTPDPGALERSSAALATAARALRWIGSGQAGEGDGSAPSMWSLAGVLPSENTALVRTAAGGVVSRVKAGAQLPDGARLISVSRDTATIERDGCQIDMPLYPGLIDTARTPDCNGAAGAKETIQP